LVTLSTQQSEHPASAETSIKMHTPLNDSHYEWRMENAECRMQNALHVILIAAKRKQQQVHSTWQPPTSGGASTHSGNYNLHLCAALLRWHFT